MRNKLSTFVALVFLTYVNITTQDKLPSSITEDILDLISEEDQNDLNLETPLGIASLWSNSLSYRNILKSMAIDASNGVDEAMDCFKGVISTLTSGNDWSIRMIDATGKPGLTSGMFDANVHALGSFEECVNIKAPAHMLSLVVGETSYNFTVPAFVGRYSLATIAPNTEMKIPQMSSSSMVTPNSRKHDDYGILNNNTLVDDFILGILLGMPRIGICTPSICSSESIEDVLGVIMQKLLLSVNVNQYVLVAKIGRNTHLLEDNNGFTAGAISALVVLAIILALSATGTVFEIFKITKGGLFNKIARCFSLKTNSQKLFSTKLDPNNINCLNGVRFLTMSWVVLGHTWYTASLIPWNNSFAVFDIYNDPFIMLILGAMFAVDTFFLIAGFLMSYLTFQKVDKNGMIIPMAIIHRYIRLTPAYGLIMFTFATLAVYVGSGPFWYFMVEQRDVCAQDWWKNLLYINNFYSSSKLCMGESWYLACDFQLFIIGLVMVVLLKLFPKTGLGVTIFSLIASCVIPGVLTYTNEWPAQQTATRVSPEWFREFYIATYTRASPYVFGILVGYVSNRFELINKTKKLSKPVVILGWTMSAALCLTALFGMKKHWEIDFTCIDKSCFNLSLNAAYAGLARLAWSIGVFWVIFACATGNGGPVNQFLSLPIFAPLNRLTFCAYLIHLHLMYIFHFGRQDIMEFGHYFLVNLFFGHFAIAMFFSVICSLLFESPFIGIEKIIFGRPRRGASRRVQNKVEPDPGNPLPETTVIRE